MKAYCNMLVSHTQVRNHFFFVLIRVHIFSCSETTHWYSASHYCLHFIEEDAYKLSKKITTSNHQCYIIDKNMNIFDIKLILVDSPQNMFHNIFFHVVNVYFSSLYLVKL
jgi:hypothetical protein